MIDTVQYKPAYKTPFFWILIAAIGVNLIGINIPFFTDDPSLYASIAKHMAQSNDFVNLYSYGRDWLDKPHFVFWVVAISFKILGASSFAYRLPGLLFFGMGAVYTWKFTSELYNKQTAWYAILILLTAQHALMSNVDMRAEPILTGLVIGAVYHFYKLVNRLSFKHLLLGALLTACAVMTKGLFTIIPIGGAVFGHLLFTSQLKQLFRWRWLWAAIATVVFILPEIYTLYVQFDLHPEKLILGRNHISGIRWFLWDSQFGRFNSTGRIIRKQSDPFFFIHTLLWAYAPWCLLLYYGIYRRIKQGLQKRLNNTEYFTISGAVLMVLIFSISKFQLPFYTNILFPFFSVIAAFFIADITSRFEFKFYQIAQTLQSVLLIAAILILAYLFNSKVYLYYIGIALVLSIALWQLSKLSATIQKIFLLSCFSSILVNTFLNGFFYPVLAAHKAQVQAAFYTNQHYPKLQPVVIDSLNDGYQFYTRKTVKFIHPDSLHLLNDSSIVYITEQRLQEIQPLKLHYQLTDTFINYDDEVIRPKFINERTRSQSLNHCYLMKILKK